MRSLFLSFLTLFASVAGAADYPLPAGADRAAERITRATLEAPIRFLASDLLEGRGPATRGDELTQLYLATEMQALGLEPGGPDGSFYQPFDIVGINAKVPDTWSFRTRGGQTLTLNRWNDFIAASGVQNERAAIENAELVFVGYGIQAPEYRWDDFKNADLKGKVLVILNNDPDWDRKLFEGNRRLYYGRWTYKYESAARQGAAGAIIIHTVPSAGYPWQVVQTSWTGEQFELPPTGEPRIEVAAWVTEDAAKQLVSAAGRDLARLVESARSRNFRPIPLGITTSLQLQNAISRKRTANVLGLLRGSERPDEVVVYTAHHDHLGTGEPDGEGDRIYNGALDNASGTAQVLAIARAFAALPQRPSRSILFNFVAAEEQGLLGSRYYATHPTFHPGKMAANLNFDGGNIWGRSTDIVQVGFGKSTLDDVVRHFAAQQGRLIKPEQFPDRGFYYRSDQFNFAKIGVPAIYLDTGVEFRDRPAGWGKQQIEAWEAKQYHQPSDEIDESWNFDGMIEDARLGFHAGLAIAQMPEMPGWNPGDEFEAARKKALAEASR
ncbi:MAG TPA: M28 family metallopeptidase [Thermoanaerobaculia bacterium]|nr:M28 family metallopeptidase [Thermoanaerobaculia bacterium]